MSKKTFSSIAGLCFIAILSIVFVLNAVIPDKKYSSSENRMLQTFPAFTLLSYFEGRFESKLSDYANDQFLMRNVFVKIKTSTDITAGKLENNGVYKGKDNYLIEDIKVPNEKYLANTETALKDFKARYPDLKMYFLLAPNAGNILSDKLPATVRVADQNKYMDDFFSVIKSRGYVPIDVRSDFNKNKGKTQLFYRTDHHWTTDGAYIAYKRIVADMGLGTPVQYKSYVVKNDFRGTLYSKSGFTNGLSDAIKIYLPKTRSTYSDSVINYSDTKKKTTDFYQTDNLKKKDAYTVFGGSNHPMYTIETPVSSSQRLLLIKDSCANSCIPFLTQHFREIVVVDPRYYFGSVDDLIASEGITQVMFLYNGNTFFADDSLAMMLEND